MGICLGRLHGENPSIPSQEVEESFAVLVPKLHKENPTENDVLSLIATPAQ